MAEAVFFDICGLAETKEAAVDTPSPQSCAQPGGESSCQTLAFWNHGAGQRNQNAKRKLFQDAGRHGLAW